LNRKQRRREAKDRQKDKAVEGGPATVLAAADAARKAGRPGDALALYKKILEKDPENATAFVGLVKIALNTNKIETAVALVGRALISEPGNTDALDAFAKVAAALDDPQKTARLNFDISQGLKQKGLFEEALVLHRKALCFDSGLAATDTQESLPLLIGGKLKEGWMAFEWRNTVGSLGPFTDKVWNGSDDVTDKTVLVWGEQGIGDQIIFINCLPDIMERAGQVIIEADDRLVDLFQRSFPKALVHGSTRFTGEGKSSWKDFSWLHDCPPVDYFIMQGSLPRFFRPTLESFPSSGGRLCADSERATAMAERLASLGMGRKVGICWRSLLRAEDRDDFYPPLECWRPIFSMPDSCFINLQAGLDRHEKEELEKRFAIDLVSIEDLDLTQDIDGTAALVSVLDAVVSTMTYLPMLSASLAVPTWRISRGGPEDEWAFLGAEKFPWFPELHVGFGTSDEDLTGQFEKAATGIVGA